MQLPHCRAVPTIRCTWLLRCQRECATFRTASMDPKATRSGLRVREVRPACIAFVAYAIPLSLRRKRRSDEAGRLAPRRVVYTRLPLLRVSLRSSSYPTLPSLSTTRIYAPTVPRYADRNFGQILVVESSDPWHPCHGGLLTIRHFIGK